MLRIKGSLTLIIYKNNPSIINTSSNITSVLYFCETIVKDFKKTTHLNFELEINMFKNCSLSIY